MDSDDCALLRGWKTRRDEECLDTIVRKYAGIVRAAGLRITRNSTDAEDVAQESFIALLRTPPPEDTHLPAWLHRVATRKALDARRSKLRRSAREETWSMHQPDAQPPHTEALESAWIEIDEAIDALPDLQRTAIILHFIQGLTHDRIAEAQGVSRPAISQRIGNGLDTLRKRLKTCAIDDAALMGLVALPATGGLPLAPATYARIKSEGAAMRASKGATAARPATWSRAGASVKLGALAAVLVLAGAGVYWARGSEGAPAATTPSITLAPEAETEPEPVVVPVRLDETAEPVQPALAQEAPVEPAAAAQIAAPVPSIAGRVYDRETGTGLPGATLHVEGYVLDTAVWKAGAPNLRITADAQGRYQTGTLPKGGYFIAVEEFPGYPLTQAGRLRKTTEIADGESVTRQVDFALSRSGALTGRITVNGIPMSNMTVTLDSLPTLAIENLTSDENGNYFVDGLGDYQGSLRARGRVSGTFRATPYVAANIQSGLTTEADFEFLEGTASIEGNVYYHTRNGETATADGNVVVTYAYVDGDEYNIENMDQRTDSNGHFLIEGLWGGRVTVGLYPSIPGIHRHRYTFELMDGEHARQDFHFYETRIDVNITRMPDDAELDVWLVAIPGHIEAVDGTPAAQRDFAESQQRSVGGVRRLADGRGAGSIGGLPPGDYTIIAAGVLGSHTLTNHAAGDEYYRRRRSVRAYATLPEATERVSIEMSFPEER